MDKNTVAGLVVVGLILLGFSWWNSGQQKKYAEEKRIADSVAMASMPVAAVEEVVVEPSVVGDSLNRVRVGNFLADAQAAEGQTLTFANEVMEIDFSTRGAHVANVRLKDYSKYGSEAPLTMYADGSSHMGVQFWLAGNTLVNTADHTFRYVGEQAVEGARRVTFELPVDSVGHVEFVYTIPNDDYMVDFDVRFVGMDGRLDNRMSQLMMEWGATLPQQEKGFENENNYSYIAHKAPGESKERKFGFRKKDSGSESVTGNVQWLAMKQQFFTTTFVARGNFQNPEAGYETFAEGSGLIKKFNAQANVAYNRSQADYGFRIYFGPVKYDILKSYDMGMERLVTLSGPPFGGIVRWVNVFLVVPVFNFLTRHIASMGLIILLLTLMIKLIILPLTWKSYLSMGKMRVLKPEIDQINEKYPKPEDAMKKQQATLELYRKAGASPMGGCLPMLIQMPIIISLFYFFPTAIELRGQSFLWAEDLSTYDSILSLPFSIPWYGSHVSLFTLLMAVTLWLNTTMTQKSQPTGPGAGMMKTMMYIMPIMLLVWFNNYASGLCYYYFLSNVITIATTWGMKLAVNDDKLHAQMKANAAKKNTASKSKGKSKWQQRYEEAVRQQQQMKKR
jgi:YidC/Oxa1 family membrane protein insertase